eukprot:g68550.t1
MCCFCKHPDTDLNELSARIAVRFCVHSTNPYNRLQRSTNLAYKDPEDATHLCDRLYFADPKAPPGYEVWNIHRQRKPKKI